MFHGSMVALVTPMRADESVDYDALRQLVDFHITEGTQALVVVGTTGESGTLTHEEKVSAIRAVVDQADERVPVIAGTYGCSTREAIANTVEAMNLGVDACLIMAPAYIRPTQEGLYQHYHAIASTAHLPIIMYNVPSRTACDLLPQTVARLTQSPNIIGLKEATGSMQRLQELQDLCGDSIDFYSGDDASSYEFMRAGGRGVISVSSNVVPKLMREFCDAVLSGDYFLAEALNDKLLPLHKATMVEANPIPVKWALNYMGKIPQGIRLPLTKLSEKYHQEFAAILTELSLVTD